MTREERTEADFGSETEPSEVRSAYAEPVNLYIRNLALDVDEQELEDAFGKFGHVVSCSIVRDPYTQVCRGFAFVKLATEEAAIAAMEPDANITLHQKVLGVERAKRNGPHKKTPGQYLGVDKNVQARYAGYKRELKIRERRRTFERDDYYTDYPASYHSHHSRSHADDWYDDRYSPRRKMHSDASVHDDYVPRRRSDYHDYDPYSRSRSLSTSAYIDEGYRRGSRYDEHETKPRSRSDPYGRNTSPSPTLRSYH